MGLPDPVGTTGDAAEIDAAARRHEIACGNGVMVWRSWGDGPPIVLLHGGSGSWSHWVRNIAPLVNAGRQVWAPDLPGFGESARPPAGGDADALPVPLEAGLQTLLGDARVDLVGFSFGGMVAAFIAAQTPGRVRRLVLSGAPALGINPGTRLVLRAWSHLEGEELALAHRANLATLMLAKPESIDELALAIHMSNLARDRMKMRRISRTDILLRTLPAVRCPVYGIWGAEDVLYRGVQERLAPALARAPGFRWLRSIPGAGHWVQFECAAAFDRALAEALDEALVS
jgi:2-hydroxy-6-oxonona-2,4-dienedioate hydrolase